MYSAELPTIPEDSTSSDMRSDIPTVLPTVMKPKKEPDVFEFYVL